MTTTIAFLGPAGTFTEAAVHTFAAEWEARGKTVETLPVDSPSAAVGAVRARQADYACVAIENSVDGAVTTTFDALVEGDPVQIYREVDVPVTFSIMTRPGTDNIKRLSTHPVAFQQIRGWVAKNAPGVEFVPASSNAAAARAVARGEVDAAAAPARAAEIFGLETTARGVADVQGAATRFVLVGLPGRPTPRTGQDRTSVIFTLPNQPGTLVGALQDFAHRGVDLSRIESRPTRQTFGNYRFYVDLIGHIDDQPVAEALRAVWLRAEELRFLGSWPTTKAAGHPPRDLAEADAWVARARMGQ